MTYKKDVTEVKKIPLPKPIFGYRKRNNKIFFF